MVRLEVPSPDLLREVLMSVRSGDDLIHRCWYTGGIRELNLLKVVALMFAAGQPGIALAESPRTMQLLEVAHQALQLLSRVHSIDGSKFRGEWFDTRHSIVRLTLLDLAVLFGHEEIARGLASLGIPMYLWTYSCDRVGFCPDQAVAVVAALSCGERFYDEMCEMLARQSQVRIRMECAPGYWMLDGSGALWDIALAAIKSGEVVVLRTMAKAGLYARPCWTTLWLRGDMSALWLLDHGSALEAAIEFGLNVNPYCVIRMLPSAWTYYGVCFWEVAILVGQADAAWRLMKPRKLSEMSALPEAAFAHGKRSRMELEDWKWLQSCWFATLTMLDEHRVCQRDLEVFVSDSLYLAARQVLEKFRSHAGQEYGVLLLQKTRKPSIACLILDFMLDCPAMLLQMSSCTLTSETGLDGVIAC